MDTIKYVAFTAFLVLGIWGLGLAVSKSVRDHEIIYPEPGVRCVVVSRMFNTSVDCWIKNEN